MKNPTIAAILKKIEEGRRFLVASHEGPDGDAIASTLALTLALREMGKEVVAFNTDGVPALPGVSSRCRYRRFRHWPERLSMPVSSSMPANCGGPDRASQIAVGVW